MTSPTRPLVLASASPQRQAILARLGVPFTVHGTEVAELETGDPLEVAVENALRKARAARANSPPSRGAGGEEAVLGVDTLVSLGSVIYGKPPHEGAALQTLRALSGATHTVFSGLALLLDDQERVAVAQTQVSFRQCSETMLDWYVATDEWRGRAGGYAIQGAGVALVREISGDYANVVGLPLAALLDIYPELL